MYIIRPLAFFPQDLKKLKKKYPRIKKDLEPLIENLEQGIFEGEKLQGFIGDVYKVRVGSIALTPTAEQIRTLNRILEDL